MLAILKNDKTLLELLLELKEKAGVCLSHRDKYGRSAAHYVVKPLIIGSFENVDFLKKLHANKFELNLDDNDGKTPADLAREQVSLQMLNALQKLKVMPVPTGGDISSKPEESQQVEEPTQIEQD